MPIPEMHHKAREGFGYRIGETQLFIGPNKVGAGKALPILAFFRPGMKEQVTAAQFPNATVADQFIEAIKEGATEVDRVFTLMSQQLQTALAANGEPTVLSEATVAGVDLVEDPLLGQELTVDADV